MCNPSILPDSFSQSVFIIKNLLCVLDISNAAVNKADQKKKVLEFTF